MSQDFNDYMKYLDELGVASKRLDSKWTTALGKKMVMQPTRWVQGEGPHKRVINADKLETMYVQYKSYGKWAVIGTIGSSDILIATYPTEAEAAAAVDHLLNTLL